MPAGFSDNGVRCRNCGKFINLFTPALPTMPDPFHAMCPYCKTEANYEKSAVQHVSGKKGARVNRGLLIAAVVVGALLLALAVNLGH